VNERAQTVERLLAALSARDMETAAAQLHPEIEARGQRGPFRGIEEVVGWAKPNDEGSLSSRIEVDEVREIGDRYVAADARRVWCWQESGEVAAEDPFGALFELRDGLIYRWRQDFASIIDAIDAIGR
jgi:limonene-1,2-epoxide hydrolase